MALHQLDFSRSLVLPELDVIARDALKLSKSAKQSAEFRAGLRRAAEDGFYVFRHVGARTPPQWFTFCMAHKHPPVTVETKVKYATVRCNLQNLGPTSKARIPGEDHARIRSLMKTFVTEYRPERFFRSVNVGGVEVQGVPIEGSRECATVLVDLLLECVFWEVT